MFSASRLFTLTSLVISVRIIMLIALVLSVLISNVNRACFQCPAWAVLSPGSGAKRAQPARLLQSKVLSLYNFTYIRYIFILKTLHKNIYMNCLSFYCIQQRDILWIMFDTCVFLTSSLHISLFFNLKSWELWCLHLVSF